MDKVYEAAAREFVNLYNETVSDHIIDIIVSVMMTRDNVQQGGGFVQAICNNDLYGAIRGADVDCAKHLRIIAISYHYAHI